MEEEDSSLLIGEGQIAINHWRSLITDHILKFKKLGKIKEGKV